MVVDAESDIDVRMRGEGVERSFARNSEAAAAIDAPGLDRTLEGLGETFDEAVAAASRVGEALERDEECLHRPDAPDEMAPGTMAEFAADQEIVRPDIDAAILLRGFGEERDAPTPRHGPQRVGAAPFDRRQDDGVDI